TYLALPGLPPFPTRRSSDLAAPSRVSRRTLAGADAPDHRLLRAERQAPAQGRRPRPRLVRGLPRVRQAGGDLRDDVHARRLRRARIALGHLEDLRVRGDPRVLRAPVL